MLNRATTLTVVACGALTALAACSSPAPSGPGSTGTTPAMSSASDPASPAGGSSVSGPSAASAPDGGSASPAAVRPCVNGQLQVSAKGMGAAMMHRGVQLSFTLASGAAPCTLQGYPGVDTGAGGPLVHARRTPSGYLGGPGGDGAPVTVQAASPAHAVVEATAMGPNGTECTMYSTLLVTPPGTSDTQTVDFGINGCELQVHPVTG